MRSATASLRSTGRTCPAPGKTSSVAPRTRSTMRSDSWTDSTPSSPPARTTTGTRIAPSRSERSVPRRRLVEPAPRGRRAGEAHLAHADDVAAPGLGTEVGPGQHEPVARMAPDALGQAPFQRRRLGPDDPTVGRPAGGAVDEDQRSHPPSHDRRVVDGQPEGDRSPERVAGDDGIVQVQGLDDLGDVVDHPAEAERGRDRRRPPEAALVDGDDPSTPVTQVGGERGEDPDVGAVPVEQHDRTSRTALLDVERAAIGGGDGVDGLGREAQATVGRRVGCRVEAAEDATLVDRDRGPDGEGRRSQTGQEHATHVETLPRIGPPRTTGPLWSASDGLSRAPSPTRR